MLLGVRWSRAPLTTNGKMQTSCQEYKNITLSHVENKSDSNEGGYEKGRKHSQRYQWPACPVWVYISCCSHPCVDCNVWCLSPSEWNIRWSIWVWRRTSGWGVLATPTAGSSGSSSTGNTPAIHTRIICSWLLVFGSEVVLFPCWRCFSFTVPPQCFHYHLQSVIFLWRPWLHVGLHNMFPTSATHQDIQTFTLSLGFGEKMLDLLNSNMKVCAFATRVILCKSPFLRTWTSNPRYAKPFVRSSGTPFWPKSPGRRGEETRNKASFISYAPLTWTRISSSLVAPRSSSKPPSRWVHHLSCVLLCLVSL